MQYLHPQGSKKSRGAGTQDEVTMVLSNARNQLQLPSNVAKYPSTIVLNHTTKKSSRIPVHNLHISNTGLFKMIVGILTTCHTQYT